MHPTDLAMPMNLLEQTATEIVRFEQMAEAACPRLVGHRFSAKIDTDGAAHRNQVMQRLVQRRVRQAESVLEEV